MKLRLVGYNELQEVTHPLHDLQLQVEQLECQDEQTVRAFYQDMVLPPGFHAMFHYDGYGYWISFLTPIS